MAKISKPAYTVSADVSPSVVPDGAGSASLIEEAEPVAPNSEPEIVEGYIQRTTVSGTADKFQTLVEQVPIHRSEGDAILQDCIYILHDATALHAQAEDYARKMGQIGKQSDAAKFSRIASAIAEMRNGLMSALS